MLGFARVEVGRSGGVAELLLADGTDGSTLYPERIGVLLFKYLSSNVTAASLNMISM